MVKLAALVAGLNSEPQNNKYRRMESLREIFFKQTEYIHSMFDVGRSMFGVHQFLSRLDWPLFRPAAALVSKRFCLHLHINPFHPIGNSGDAGF